MDSEIFKRLFNSILIVGMIFTGCVNTIVKKAQFETSAPGTENYGRPHVYIHAYFQTLPMFIGEAMCMIPFLLSRFDVWKMRRAGVPVPPEKETSAPYFSFVFALPAACDLIATTTAGVSLLWINASLWQMLRGSTIVWSGILSVLFLKRRLLPYKWLGITIVTAGLVLVGLSSFVGSSASIGTGTRPEQLLGILLTVGGQFIAAVQMVLEEKLLKDRGFTPLQSVGSEGLWGCFYMIFIVIPVLYFIPNPTGAQNNHFEDSVDAVVQIFSSLPLFALVWGYVFSIAFYNAIGLTITKVLSTVHRALIDTLRTGFIWVFEVIVYYTISKNFGQEWVNPGSWIQIIGFVMLAVGTFIYNEVFRVPYFNYDLGVPAKVERYTEPINSGETTGLLPQSSAYP